MKNYYRIFSEIPNTTYEKSVEYLRKALSENLTELYELQFEDADVRHFNDNVNRNYMMYFDCTDDYSDDFFGRAARVVFVFAKSAFNPTKRNSYRLRQMGSFKNVPQLEGYDKGHFIAHCNDGQLDQNIYPQLKELNRGISLQGKLFRSMERYCQRNPGIFYFIRPLYTDLTCIPDKIDFGIFTRQGGLLLNRFDNRNTGTEELPVNISFDNSIKDNC
ncbi:DNA/RNA non-specific endonuclease [Mucilaginibacter oryzae]|uniref:DNA/RNA non-specific endonuclease n=1 Tax=Mucilaginibacter oryzae TaxID=468058 RepID=A0A316GVP9_9SPHI|nr:DNA/RNA non-specific endonuclease [Mucilaginibacter oryzae]PWK68319.1 DNA/RNA non-specific endonuclease [Mucilaginibacter oryzae]